MMNLKSCKRSIRFGAVFVTALLAGAAWAGSLPDGPYISTSATASREVPPDHAVIDLNFRTVEATVEDARDATDAAQQTLIKVLEPYEQALGDWRLEALRFGEHWEYQRPEIRTDSAGFFGEFSVALKVTDFEALPKLHYALAGLEWQSLGNPRFEVAEPELAEAAVRRQALEQAAERARDLAEAGGVRLGRLWGVINEPMHDLAGGGAFRSNPAGPVTMRVGAARSEGTFALPMEPRPVRFEVRVGVVFTLETAGPR